MNKKEVLQKIAMHILKQGEEIKELRLQHEADKKASDVNSLVAEMIERGIISEAIADNKREELLSKTAEEISHYRDAIKDITVSTTSIGEVSKESSAYTGKEGFDAWLLGSK